MVSASIPALMEFLPWDPSTITVTKILKHSVLEKETEEIPRNHPKIAFGNSCPKAD